MSFFGNEQEQLVDKLKDQGYQAASDWVKEQGLEWVKSDGVSGLSGELRKAFQECAVGDYEKHDPCLALSPQALADLANIHENQALQRDVQEAVQALREGIKYEGGEEIVYNPAKNLGNRFSVKTPGM